MLKFKNEAVGLPLVILAALIVGAMAGISLVSTTSAHSAQVINARVTQTCGDLGTIRPLVEGQPSTEFPLQTVSVPSNVNSYV